MDSRTTCLEEDMVYRIAEALAGCMDVFPLGDSREYLTEAEARTLAKAAIEAMREPTKAMVDSAAINWPDASDTYSTMIDAALTSRNKP